MEMKGADLSRWNYVYNYELVAKELDFVILKAGGSDAGFYKDGSFEQKYNRFSKLYVPMGAYYFVGPEFYGKGAGVADAKRFLDQVKGKRFEFPLFLDIESTSPAKKAEATTAAIWFCETLEEAGYYASIYASDISGFKDRLEIERLTAYDKWVARYGSKPKYVTKYGIWQASSSGRVDGIQGNVDIDYAYMDYPAIIKKAGLNHLK